MTIVESFKTPKEDMLPLRFVITPETTDEDFWEFSEEQDVRFNLALERMKVCSFMLGFTSPYKVPTKTCMGFKWCPHKEWEEHFRKVL